MTGVQQILAAASTRVDLRLMRLGFQMWHVGRVSRAWRKFLPNGEFVLVTDVGGFDVPHDKGPYVVCKSSALEGIETDAILLTEPAKLWEFLAALPSEDQGAT